MDLSYGLASTLVEWGKDKQIAGGLCDKWDVINDHTYRLYLRKNIRWSNGEPITGGQVKRSFERAFQTYPQDLSSLIKMLKSIVPNSDVSRQLKMESVAN